MKDVWCIPNMQIYKDNTKKSYNEPQPLNPIAIRLWFIAWLFGIVFLHIGICMFRGVRHFHPGLYHSIRCLTSWHYSVTIYLKFMKYLKNWQKIVNADSFNVSRLSICRFHQKMPILANAIPLSTNWHITRWENIQVFCHIQNLNPMSMSRYPLTKSGNLR